MLTLVVLLRQDCFELGVILLRKKLYTQATKNLEKAARMWEGEPEELAQVGWSVSPPCRAPLVLLCGLSHSCMVYCAAAKASAQAYRL